MAWGLKKTTENYLKIITRDNFLVRSGSARLRTPILANS